MDRFGLSIEEVYIRLKNFWTMHGGEISYGAGYSFKFQGKGNLVLVFDKQNKKRVELYMHNLFPGYTQAQFDQECGRIMREVPLVEKTKSGNIIIGPINTLNRNNVRDEHVDIIIDALVKSIRDCLLNSNS